MAGVTLTAIIRKQNGEGTVEHQGGTPHHDAAVIANNYPAAYIETGDTMDFINETNENVLVVIPLDPTKRTLSERIFRLGPGQHKSLAVRNWVTPGVYRYCVLLEETDVFATAGSTPKKMIEPPGGDPMPPLF